MATSGHPRLARGLPVSAVVGVACLSVVACERERHLHSSVPATDLVQPRDAIKASFRLLEHPGDVEIDLLVAQIAANRSVLAELSTDTDPLYDDVLVATCSLCTFLRRSWLQDDQQAGADGAELEAPMDRKVAGIRVNALLARMMGIEGTGLQGEPSATQRRDVTVAFIHDLLPRLAKTRVEPERDGPLSKAIRPYEEAVSESAEAIRQFCEFGRGARNFDADLDQLVGSVLGTFDGIYLLQMAHTHLRYHLARGEQAELAGAYRLWSANTRIGRIITLHYRHLVGGSWDNREQR